MTLEDRIRNTGEHFLGTFEPNPELPDQISKRIDRRVRQRRQRAAWGLGAGAVAVMGGLVVANLQPGSNTPVELAAAQSGLTEPLRLTTLPATSAPTPPTSPPPVAADPSAGESTATSTSAIAEGVGATSLPASNTPVLLTLFASASMIQAVDLNTGRLSDRPEATGPPPDAVSRTSTTGLSYRLSPDDQDACGQSRLTVSDSSDTQVAGLPDFVRSLLLSDDGGSGAIEYATCGGDAPSPATPTIAMFNADEPGAGSWPVALPGFPTDFGADGRLVAVPIDGDRTSVIDVGTGQVVWTSPDGCTALTGDRARGVLIGEDGFAAVAWCDGQPSLWAGRLPDVGPISPLGCRAEDQVSLDVYDPRQSDPKANWFAVHDATLESVWVIGADRVSPAVPVGERVWWEHAAA